MFGLVIVPSMFNEGQVVSYIFKVWWEVWLVLRRELLFNKLVKVMTLGTIGKEETSVRVFVKL